MSCIRRVNAWARLAGLTLAALCAAFLGTGLFVSGHLSTVMGASEESAPKFKLDPNWPKPLPNKWKIGGITGLAVDKDDNVWVYDRPNDLTDIELEAELTPPIADCCKLPPSLIHFDKDGNVIGTIDPPQGHGMAVDAKGFIYTGNDVDGFDSVHKYDPKTGKLLGTVPHAPEREPGSERNQDAAPPEHVPGHGTAGPIANFVRPAGAAPRRAQPSPEAAAARAAALKAFQEKYPPSAPMIVGNIEEVRIDDQDHELYASDSYLGGRVMVFDLDTLAYLLQICDRSWVARVASSGSRDTRPGLAPERKREGIRAIGVLSVRAQSPRLNDCDEFATRPKPPTACNRDDAGDAGGTEQPAGCGSSPGRVGSKSSTRSHPPSRTRFSN